MKHHPYSGPAWLCLLIVASCSAPEQQEKNVDTLTTSSETATVESKTQPTSPAPDPQVNFTRVPVFNQPTGLPARGSFVSYHEWTQPAPIVYELCTRRDTVITDHQGLTLEIPADAFVHADGTVPSGNIEFTLQSFHDNLSILKQGLTTTCDGKLIETAGMFYCDASAGGKSLTLRKSIAVRLQASEIKEGMQVFYGEQQTDGVLNWVPATGDATVSSVNNGNPASTGGQGRRSSFLRTGLPGGADTYKVSGYIWDVTSANKRERFRQLDSDRPASWTSKIYSDLVKADKLLWKNIFDITRLEVSMQLLENSRYELIVIPSDNALLDSLVRQSTREYWDKVRYPRYVDEHDQVRYKSTFYLRMAPSGNKYLASLNKQEKNKQITVANGNEMNMITSYALNITRMGWVNCDRFVSESKNKEVIVMLPENFKGRVQLALSSIRSFLPGVKVNNRIVFRGVPEGEKFTVVWFDANEKGQLMLAKYNGVADGSIITQADYRKVTMGQLQTEMTSL